MAHTAGIRDLRGAAWPIGRFAKNLLKLGNTGAFKLNTGFHVLGISGFLLRCAGGAANDHPTRAVLKTKEFLLGHRQ